MVQPTRAYFGQKDAQQAAVVQDLVTDLDIGSSWGICSSIASGNEASKGGAGGAAFDPMQPGLEIIIAPTVREPDGLAKSSRNSYLSEHERDAAPVLYRALCAGRDFAASKNGTATVAEISDTVIRGISEEPLFHTVDYVTVADVRTMEPLPDKAVVSVQDERGHRGALLIAAAAKIGTTRLIDNLILSED